VAAGEPKFSNVLVPVYLILLNTILTLIIFFGSRAKEMQEKMSLAPLQALPHRYSARMRHHI